MCLPGAGSTKQLWDMPERRLFILACPVEGCDLGGRTLHDLIKRYGGESMFKRWRKARWKTTMQRIGSLSNTEEGLN